MRLRYLLEESRDGFRRAWGSCVLSILTVAFFLTLLGFLTLISANISYFKSRLNEQLQMQAFISNTLDDRGIAGLADKLKRIPGVIKVQFISKDDAARAFEREFGKEMFSVLQENPLPASFTLLLSGQYNHEAGIEQIAAEIKQQPGIDEVVYHFKTWLQLQRYASLANTTSWILLLFVTVGSLFVISNNIRLVIAARQHIITTMRMVGATAAFIRTPLFIEGTLQGMIGGGIAAMILLFLFKFINATVPGVITIPGNILGILILLGAVLGLLGSALAVRKYL